MNIAGVIVRNTVIEHKPHGIVAGDWWKTDGQNGAVFIARHAFALKLDDCGDVWTDAGSTAVVVAAGHDTEHEYDLLHALDATGSTVDRKFSTES